MTDQSYRNLLADLVEDLIERAEDPLLFTVSDLNTGYRQALYTVLSRIECQARDFGLDPRTVGFGNFSPDDWFRLGREYQR
jgi:hypothetical protein